MKANKTGKLIHRTLNHNQRKGDVFIMANPAGMVMNAEALQAALRHFQPSTTAPPIVRDNLLPLQETLAIYDGCLRPKKGSWAVCSPSELEDEAEGLYDSYPAC